MDRRFVLPARVSDDLTRFLNAPTIVSSEYESWMRPSCRLSSTAGHSKPGAGGTQKRHEKFEGNGRILFPGPA
jgi:hypothetical protein